LRVGIFDEYDKKQHEGAFGEGRAQGREADFGDQVIAGLGEIFSTVVPPDSVWESNRAGFWEGVSDRNDGRDTASSSSSTSYSASSSAGYGSTGYTSSPARRVASQEGDPSTEILLLLSILLLGILLIVSVVGVMVFALAFALVNFLVIGPLLPVFMVAYGIAQWLDERKQRQGELARRPQAARGILPARRDALARVVQDRLEVSTPRARATPRRG